MTTNPVYQPQRLTAPAASHTDMERIMRYLERCHAVECPSCREIHPPSKPHDNRHIFGVCRECFLYNEDLDGVIDFAKLCAHDIYSTYSRWLRDGKIFDHFAPYGNRLALNAPPIEYDLLRTLYCWIGEDRIKQIIADKSPAANSPYAGGGARAFFHADAVRWSKEHGFVPVATPTELLPDKQDRKAWEALMQGIYTFDHLESV